MNKLEHVTNEVFRIVTENNQTTLTARVWNLRDFNTISGRHEIECFFGIEFEQEQVDAWTTVQNVIDDVMNLWVAPISTAAERAYTSLGQGADPKAIHRLETDLKRMRPIISNTRVQVEPKIPTDSIWHRIAGTLHIYRRTAVDPAPAIKPDTVLKYMATDRDFIERATKAIAENFEIDIPDEVRDNWKTVGDVYTTVRDILDKRVKINTDRAQVAAINRIERSDVEQFKEFKDIDEGMGVPNTLDHYQSIATKSAIYPGKGTPFGLMYAALGLAEAGEVQNKVKKAFRDDGVILFHPDETVKDRIGRDVVSFQPITPERRKQIVKELGGVLWYIAAVCDEIGATMSEVALTNLDELCGRGERNTLRGDGDDR